jgi:mono/diheme cytochrome c family protein
MTANKCSRIERQVLPRSAVLTFLTITGSLLPAAQAQDSSAGGIAEVTAFIETHCIACHGPGEPEAGLDLSGLRLDFSAGDAAFRLALKVHDRVAAGEMPPPAETQPDASRRGGLLTTLARDLAAAEQKFAVQSGRTVLRRLNRVEYENTIRDLLNVAVNVRDILPPDTPSHGFDTVADGLRFSQLQIEKYLEAADVALDAAIDLTEEPERFHKRMSLRDEKAIRENLDTPEGTVTDPVANHKHRVLFRELPDAVVMFSTGYPPGDFRQFSAPASGRYRIRASGYAYQTDGEPATLRIFTHRFREKQLLGFFEMPPQPREVEMIVDLERDHLVQVLPHGVGFDATGKGIWNVGAAEFRGSGLAVQWLEVEGPLGEWPPASVRTVFPDVPLREIPKNQRRWREKGALGWELAPEDPAVSARRVIEHFAGRAFRRPLRDDEAEPFVQLALNGLAAGRSFEDCCRVGLRAVLISPQFLFLDERPGALDDFALASRLSYFLWSTAPDEELLSLAAEGRLSQPDVLRAQTERLLSDARSATFVRNFTGQWLDLRNIKATSPDKQLYPEFDEMLELSMVRESEAFFAELLTHDLSVTNLVDSDFVMLNRAMARHYGIPGPAGETFERVPVPAGNPRGGVLTQAAILKVTANGTVTSPVMRGAWVMKRMLGRPPQPPPPNVGSVEPDTRGATTIRDLLDKHRNTETCARCHSRIDPPGFALESFDVIGGWRDRYRSLGRGDKPPWKLEGNDIWQYKLGPAVDASGQMPDGRKFADVSSFKQLLLDEQPQIMQSLTGNLLTYATGAGVRFSDRDDVDRIVQDVSKSGSGLRTLVHAIVQSEVFRSK